MERQREASRSTHSPIRCRLEAPTMKMSEFVIEALLRAQETVELPRIAIDWGRISQGLNFLRSLVLLPLLKFSLWVCIVGSSMVLMEKVLMGSVSLLVKILRRRPRGIYPCTPLAIDEELGSAAFPTVIVQIPMYNEKEVYHLSIGAACRLQWPTDRLIIQVLDDSTDPVLKDLVRQECEKWSREGINVRYETREGRKGYKAGALRQGMKHSYVGDCEYVAIFDADFQPEPDFLQRAIPFLVHNLDVALVQARWKFVNANECLMTRIQEISMDYHFKVEQEAGSSTLAFFGFNGTAGVWRIHAINEAGGWKDRTTVEDMDLAIRATLRGWKFIYLGDIKVKSELPSTFKAYRYQQHRWSCGPANLVKKMGVEIVTSKKVSCWKKFYILYNFFFVRRILSHFVTFFFYSVVIPTASFFPEVQIPLWAMTYAPSFITLLSIVGTPRSVHLLGFWVLFENVMSLHRCKAMIMGLLDIGRVNEWVVTQKLGDSNSISQNKERKFSWSGLTYWFSRFHILELCIGIYLLICGSYNYAHKEDYCYVYIYFQSCAYFIAGVGYVGTFITNSK